MTCAVVAVLLFGGAVTDEPLLSLDEAVRVARASHPKVDAARAQLDVARAQLSQATAGFLPGLTGAVGYQPQSSNTEPRPGLRRLLTHLAPPGVTFSRPPPSYALESYWTAQLGVYWNAWDWGATIYQRRAARAGVEAQRYGVQTQRNDVALAVKQAFFELVAVQSSITVAKEGVARAERNVDAARRAKPGGDGARDIDVATAESDLRQTQLTLVLIAGALSSAQAALALAMGQERWGGYRLQPLPTVDDAPPPEQAAATDTAERDRPEPRTLSWQARGYEEAARAVRGQFLPQLVFQGGPSWAGDSVGAVTNVGLAVSLSYPLTGLNPFLVRAQMRQAESERTLTLAEERQARDEVSYQVADAISEMSTAQDSLVAIARWLGAARERYELARTSYAAGTVDAVQLSESTRLYLEAELREVTATLNANVARARLDWSLGRER